MDAENKERRAAGICRIQHKTRVEICGREPSVPAFEAESIEISGRGMHVRADYLPEVKAPLVLRFKHDEQAVIVEGDVAWRRKNEQGGVFGIKFTALDSGSVVALKDLCSGGAASPAVRPRAEEATSRPEPVRSTTTPASDATPPAELGAAIKLHIEGLAAPMKARVFEGNERKVRVGSQLSFLRIGRNLELEDIGAESRRAVTIDTVDVAVDPESQVPQLVVALRYCDSERTPEPCVVSAGSDADSDQERFAEQDLTAGESGQTHDDEDYEEGDEFAEDDESTEDLFRGRVESWASSAGSAMKGASVKMAGLGTLAAGGLGGLVKPRAPQRASKPRRTARATGAYSARPPAPRRSRGRTPSRAQQESPRAESGRRRTLLMGAVGVAAVGAGVYTLSFNETPTFQVDERQVAAQVRATEVQQPMPAGQFPKPAVLSATEQLASQSGAIVADVPLFGPTAMSSSEPAPVAPVATPVVDELSLAKDQAFLDKPLASVKKAKQLPAVAPEVAETAPKAWQVGRMHLPVVHRLRLDGAGEALQGKKTPSGFQVLVPGRKVMETGSAIAQRDDRILGVRVTNTPAGGKVLFRFGKVVPGYKVRLRKDYVEFFINSPEK